MEILEDQLSIEAALLLSRQQDVDDSKIPLVLGVLELYECWTPFIRLITQAIESVDADADAMGLSVWLFRTQIARLRNTEAAIETARRAIKQHNLKYSEFSHHFLRLREGFLSHDLEAQVLVGVNDCFGALPDRVAALERMCHIFEKKKYDSDRLYECYDRLYKIDPYNIRALKFLKLLYQQTREYNKSVEILERMASLSSPNVDQGRVALELASIYFYQLDKPKKALEIMAGFEFSDRLDGSTILFEANLELKNWTACIGVIESCLQRISNPQHRAVLMFKKGEILESLSDYKEAEACYRKVLDIDGTFLEAIENLIDLNVRSGNWKSVEEWIDRLRTQVFGEVLVKKLERLRQRIECGLCHAG